MGGVQAVLTTEDQLVILQIMSRMRKVVFGLIVVFNVGLTAWGLGEYEHLQDVSLFLIAVASSVVALPFVITAMVAETSPSLTVSGRILCRLTRFLSVSLLLGVFWLPPIVSETVWSHRVTQAMAHGEALATRLEEWKQQHGEYPPDLDAVVQISDPTFTHTGWGYIPHGKSFDLVVIRVGDMMTRWEYSSETHQWTRIDE